MKPKSPGSPQVVFASLPKIIDVENQIELIKDPKGAENRDVYDWLKASRSNLYKQLMRYARTRDADDDDEGHAAAKKIESEIKERIKKERAPLADAKKALEKATNEKKEDEITKRQEEIDTRMVKVTNDVVKLLAGETLSGEVAGGRTSGAVKS